MAACKMTEKGRKQTGQLVRGLAGCAGLNPRSATDYRYVLLASIPSLGNGV